MSKTQLKKFLNTLNHDQITEMVLELYAARKEAKDYLDYFMNPDEEKMQEKYRAIITKEFLPGPGRVKGRTSRCRKAIKEFATLHPHPSRIADLMLTTVESIMSTTAACDGSRSRRRMPPRTPCARLSIQYGATT